MSIEKFEVGKKYRCLKDGGKRMYGGCDVTKGQEFVVHYKGTVDSSPLWVWTRDLTHKGRIGEFAVFHGKDKTTLDDFEEVRDDCVDAPPVHVSNNTASITIEPSPHPAIVYNPESDTISCDFLKATSALAKENNMLVVFNNDDIEVTLDNDVEYKVNSLEELNILLEASKVMKQFECN
tara:strand:+ start:356 stop:892 length:537 start_codon:yes stop_codon:yes gene_type:complete